MTAGGTPARPVAAPPLLSFVDASARVVAFLRQTLPMGFWSVTQHRDDRQVYLTVTDDVYGSVPGARQIPLDSLKVDRSFTRELGESPAADRFMRALLSLGRDLGLDVVVEGVEHEGQAAVLRRLGATHAQGWLFGRPPPADQVRLIAVERVAAPRR